MDRIKGFVLVMGPALLLLVAVGIWSSNYKPNVIIERPMVMMDGTAYISVGRPVNELPEGFAYAGALTEEEAYNTGHAGCKYYMNPDLEGEFYLYQEYGTVLSDGTAERQWAYFQHEVCPDS